MKKSRHQIAIEQEIEGLEETFEVEKTRVDKLEGDLNMAVRAQLERRGKVEMLKRLLHSGGADE